MLNSVVVDEYPNLVVENATISDKYKEAASHMAESAVEEFLKLCKIVRCSGDCKDISEYLYNWAKEHNLKPNVDDELNVFWDIAATPGCENWPKVILQTHMDMIWECKNANLSTPQTVDAVYDKESGTIHSRNFETTLGSDPGQGIITLLEMSKFYGFNHGPLRILFTVNEETSMSGSIGLNSDVLDTDYLINVDGRQASIVRIFSCGALTLSYKKNYCMVKSENNTQIKIDISGLLGGHSANTLIYKRVNAIDVLRRILIAMNERDINFDLISLEGGQSSNAIPYSSEMKLACSNSDVDIIKEISYSVLEKLMEESLDDKNGKCTFEVSDLNSEVFSSEDTKQMMELLNTFRYELIDMNEEVSGVPKNSLNIGNANIKDGNLDVVLMCRFGEEEFFNKIVETSNDFAEKFQMNFEAYEYLPAWYPSKNRKLLNTYKRASKEVCNVDIITSGTHGGLEVGMFLEKRPSLECISFGADVKGEHSTNETFYTKSLPYHFATLIRTLETFN